MDLSVLLTGLFLGLSIAAPVGPIAVLCIRRTLAEGRAVGFASGLGAAAADAMYGAVAAFGLTLVSDLLVSRGDWLRLVGGLFLCYLGVKTLLARPAAAAAPARGGTLLAAFGSTFALTVTNPMTILSFAAIFGGLGIAAGATFDRATLLVLGVFAGSALWWLILSGGVGLLRSRLDQRLLLWVNRVSGLCIALFGLGILISLIA